jgi:hypothetical protein
VFECSLPLFAIVCCVPQIAGALKKKRRIARAIKREQGAESSEAVRAAASEAAALEEGSDGPAHFFPVLRSYTRPWGAIPSVEQFTGEPLPPVPPPAALSTLSANSFHDKLLLSARCD